MRSPTGPGQTITFTSDHGHVREVDLFIVTPGGLFRHGKNCERLDHFLSTTPELPLPTRLGMIRQLAEALDHAHRRHLYHRVSRPARSTWNWTANVMQEPEATRLVDLLCDHEAFLPCDGSTFLDWARAEGLLAQRQEEVQYQLSGLLKSE